LFALLNIFQLNYDLQKYHSCILINIGMDTTDAAFLQNGMFHSSRDIPIAGSNFMNQLSIASGLPPEELHNVLNGRIKPELDKEPIITALNNVSKEFANAVGVSVSYYQSSDGVDKIDLIVFAGGYTFIPGLFNILELRTGAEVVLLKPFNTISYNEAIMSDIDPEKMGAILSVAMGLASRVQ